jgi:hypothetical protein
MQPGLIQFSPEHGDTAAGAHVQAAERRRRRFIKPAHYADLIARAQKHASNLQFLISRLYRNRVEHLLLFGWRANF